MELSQEQYEFIKELNYKTAFFPSELVRLYQIHNEVFGYDAGCTSCPDVQRRVRTAMYKKMEEYVPAPTIKAINNNNDKSNIHGSISDTDTNINLDSVQSKTDKRKTKVIGRKK